MDSPQHFLTRLRYKLAERELARQLRNPYEQHRTLWTLFADAPNSELVVAPRTFLFRQNREPALAKLGVGEFVVISDRPALADSRFQAQVKPYRPLLAAGDALHFQLRAEVLASKAGKDAEGKRLRGKKHDPMLSALGAAEKLVRGALRSQWLHGGADSAGNITPALLLSDWLAPKLARLGFALDLASSRAESHETVRLKRDGQVIYFSEADFLGQLRVTDPTLATLAALGGIGHSKAFGCGLLLLRRVQIEAQDD